MEDVFELESGGGVNEEVEVTLDPYETLTAAGYCLESFDGSSKIISMPFRKFGSCVSHRKGIMICKYQCSGHLRALVKKLKVDFKMSLPDDCDFRALIDYIRSRRDIHCTILKMRDENISSLTVFECFNCVSKRDFIADKKKKLKSENDQKDLFLMLIDSESSFSDYKYHVLKIKDIFQVCDACGDIFSTSGHICDNVCKLLNTRSIDGIFKKNLCLDVFYDIETYKSSENGGKFVPGLVAFTLNVYVSNSSNFPPEKIANSYDSYVNMINYNLDDILKNYECKSMPVTVGSHVKPCYYLRDETLDEKDDIMLSFLIILEMLTSYMFSSFKELDLESRVTVVSFNGNKFDDFFLFKALTKKGGFCGLGLEKCTILERGSKLLCIPFRLKSDNGKNLYFRTQDLRNFLSTGSLSSNAKKFQIECQKTCFPHSLIDAVRDGSSERVLNSYPEFRYFADQLQTPSTCEHLTQNCLTCKENEYLELKESYGSGGFDVLDVWTKYCCNDVLVTEVLYYNFITSIREQFAPLFKNRVFDPSSKLTLPSLTNSLGYKVACMDYKKLLYSPVSDCLRTVYEAVYGGHCQTSVIGSVPNPEKFVFFDFNGEYSGLMTAPYPCGLITRIGKSRMREINSFIESNWYLKENAHFQDCKAFICLVEMIAPSDPKLHFDLPNVPERDRRGTLVWSNRSKKGFYSSVDCFVASKFYGYKVKILNHHTNMEFAEWKPLLKTYVEYCQKLKIDGKIEKNAAKENVGKLMGNALYGYQIKKPDCEKMEFVPNEETYVSLKLQEQSHMIKIKSVCPVKDIIVSYSKPKFVLEKSSEPPWDDGVNLPLYCNDMFDPENDTRDPLPCDYPVYVKYSVTEAFRLECNTLPQIGVFVLSFSRLLNTQLYFDCFIKEEEKNLTLEERGEPIVMYTDTDSFLVHGSRLEGTQWNGNKNVCYNYDENKFEPWGKNELNFVPEKIIIAGKKLYVCKGPSDDPKLLKTASKGVDKKQITVEKFERLIAHEKVLFEQTSFKKNFDTYDIECNTIKRQLGLGSLSMKPYKTTDNYVYYRPFNDNDDISFDDDDVNDETSVDFE